MGAKRKIEGGELVVTEGAGAHVDWEQLRHLDGK